MEKRYSVLITDNVDEYIKNENSPAVIVEGLNIKEALDLANLLLEHGKETAIGIEM